MDAALDLAEVQKFLKTCTRPVVRQHLAKLEEQLKRAAAAEEAKAAQEAKAKEASAKAEVPASAEKPTTSAYPSTASTKAAGNTSVYVPTGGAWTEISSFTFEAGEYNSDKVKVSVRFEGIGKHPKENISVTFGKSQFDLKIMNWQGKNWRLVKTNLEKEVDTEKCAFKVTNNSVYIYLAKIKGEFGYPSWTELCEKRAKKPENKDNPTAGLMDMMRDMYNDGDDNMRKAIGEAMVNAQAGKTDPRNTTMDDL